MRRWKPRQALTIFKQRYKRINRLVLHRMKVTVLVNLQKKFNLKTRTDIFSFIFPEISLWNSALFFKNHTSISSTKFTKNLEFCLGFRTFSLFLIVKNQHITILQNYQTQLYFLAAILPKTISLDH